jgi:hypothetical protein
MLLAANEVDSEQDESHASDDVRGVRHHHPQHVGRKGDEGRDASANLGREKDTDKRKHPKLRKNEELLVIEAPPGWLGIVIGT